MAAALVQLEAERQRRSDLKDQLQSGELIQVCGVEGTVAIATGVPRGENFGAVVSHSVVSDTHSLGKPQSEPPRRRDHTEVLPMPPKVHQGPQRIDTIVQGGEASGMPDKVVSV